MLVMKSSRARPSLGEQVGVVAEPGHRHVAGERAALPVPVGEAHPQRHQDRHQQEQAEDDHDGATNSQPGDALRPRMPECRRPGGRRAGATRPPAVARWPSAISCDASDGGPRGAEITAPRGRVRCRPGSARRAGSSAAGSRIGRSGRAVASLVELVVEVGEDAVHLRARSPGRAVGGAVDERLVGRELLRCTGSRPTAATASRRTPWRTPAAGRRRSSPRRTRRPAPCTCSSPRCPSTG